MRLLFVLLLGIALLATAYCVTELEVGMGIDGLRCDSCGSECSTVCGSRAFRTCCFNYIKKRSVGGAPAEHGVQRPLSRLNHLRYGQEIEVIPSLQEPWGYRGPFLVPSNDPEVTGRKRRST